MWTRGSRVQLFTYSSLSHSSLRVIKVLAEVTELPGKLVHHLLEDHRVHVLAQHVEKEPVADEGLLDDGVDDFPPDEPEADVEEVGAHLGAEDDDEPVEDHEGAQEGEQDEPGTQRGVIEVRPA